jgi:hypothetical protein
MSLSLGFFSHPKFCVFIFFLSFMLHVLAHVITLNLIMLIIYVKSNNHWAPRYAFCPSSSHLTQMSWWPSPLSRSLNTRSITLREKHSRPYFFKNNIRVFEKRCELFFDIFLLFLLKRNRERNYLDTAAIFQMNALHHCRHFSNLGSLIYSVAHGLWLKAMQSHAWQKQECQQVFGGKT